MIQIFSPIIGTKARREVLDLPIRYSGIHNVLSKWYMSGQPSMSYIETFSCNSKRIKQFRKKLDGTLIL